MKNNHKHVPENKRHIGVCGEDPMAFQGIKSYLESSEPVQVSTVTLSELEKDINGYSVAILDFSRRQLQHKRTLSVLSNVGRRMPLLVRIPPNGLDLVSTLRDRGAAGLLLTNCPPDELLKGVRVLLKGQQFLSGRLEEFVNHGEQINGIIPSKETAGLTPQQTKVLELIAEGLTNKEIAARMGISLRTVENHRHALKKKLGAHSTAELVRFAFHELGN